MWWFDTWNGILRVLAVGAVAYVLLVVLLRISGKRTLSKLNAFDLVVTVAMGSMLASALLSKDVPLAESAAGMAVLITGQYLIARLSVRSRRFAHWVRAEPRLLVLNGAFLDDALTAERITRDDVLSAIRGQGLSRLEEVGAVVLETDGSLHVMKRLAQDHPGALEGVCGPGD